MLLPAVACLLPSPPADGQVRGTIRNGNPQRAASTDDHEDRIYFPGRLTRRADESTAQSGSAEDLLQLFMHYHTSRRYEEAVEVALRLVDRAPDRPMVHYNLACVLSRLYRIDDALDALDHAIERGWRNVAHTMLDTDLQAVRNDDRFTARLTAMQALIDEERLTARPLRADSWQDVAAEIERDAPAMLERAHVPGAAVALIDGGKVVWTGAFGRRHVESEDGHRTTDRYRLTSPARLSTLIVAARRQQEGHLQVAELLQHVAELDLVAAQDGRPAQTINRPARRKVPGRNYSVHNRATWPVSGPTLAQQPATNERILLTRDSDAFRLFRLALDLAIEEGLMSRCRADVFESLDLASTGYQAAGEAPTVSGHTELGTPIRVPDEALINEATVYTNLEDLARLWAALMLGRDRSADDAGGPATITGLETIMYGGPALGVDVRQTDHGPRVQLFETTDGQGCLMRMYPKTGRGVVIVFNSATGAMPALRLAQLALGGI